MAIWPADFSLKTTVNQKSRYKINLDFISRYKVNLDF